MEENILKSVKDSVGINYSENVFDDEIIMHINMAFSTLFQLGIGKGAPYKLEDKSLDWISMFSDYLDYLSFIKEYTYLKVKILFDPPSNTSLLDAYTKQLNEIEYRIIMQIEGNIVEED